MTLTACYQIIRLKRKLSNALFLISIPILISSCVPIAGTYSSSQNASTDKQLIYENAVYEDDILTVQLYPTRNQRADLIQPAVNTIDQQNPMVLRFDHIYHDSEDFRVRLVHCNADWKPSNYQSIDILHNYNEFRIQDFQQSFNTRVPYTHYTFNLPLVKLAGNYLVVVYRGGNENDLILSRRYMVVDNKIGISPRAGLSSSVAGRALNQQIDFVINYSNLEITNPLEEIYVVLRQNRRWDNAISGLKPNFVKEFQKELSFELFDLSNNFKGGNEFRFFDFRSVNFAGQNVNNIERNENEIIAGLMMDKSRQEEVYSTLRDLNGGYVVDQVDANNPHLEADYATINFYLKTEELPGKKVYVLGEMNDWKKIPSNQMRFNPGFNGYTGQQFLKQGWYNYMYSVDGENPYLLEGSHFETENFYEIMVYYRPIGGRGDFLLGYRQILHNSRN